MLLVKFVQELFHVAPAVFTMSESAVILAILTLIDLSLAGNLLLIIHVTFVVSGVLLALMDKLTESAHAKASSS